MNIVVIGSGGREYALIKSLLKTKNKIDIYCLGEYLNPGILHIVRGFKIMNDFKIVEFIDFIKKINPRFVVVGPEKYLNLKISECLYNQGIPCIGPFGIMARIETSKIYCRQFMKEKYSKYSPKFIEINRDMLTNISSIFNEFNNDFVIKPNGLTGGKGVKIFNNNNKAALNYLKELFKSDSCVLLEERLKGEEFIQLSFCDGKSIKHMPIVKDFKRLNEDSDINTGSMGSLIQSNHKLNFLNDNDLDEARYLNKEIMLELSKLHEYGYRGILYGSYMKTNNGVKLIEFNARFGDPEVIPILDLLETDLFDVFEAITLQKLDKIDIIFRNSYSLCKYLVPSGYPKKNLKMMEINIEGVDAYNKDSIYLAGVKSENSKMVTTGSRALAVCVSGNEIEYVHQEVEKIINQIKGDFFFRKDIKNVEINVNNIYKNAGVNIEEGNKVVSKIRNHLENTYDDNVETLWGDFGGLYNMGKLLKNNNYVEPIMVSSTDGVGTKTCFILENMRSREGMIVLGQDIVNHCVNDILVKGAIPLMFLDYFASSKISSDLVASFVEGVSKACKENNCSLMGGETAEMPGVYNEGKCDIVGTIMGIVDKKDIINGKDNIKEGFLVYGISSSGPHTNGYSLIRKVYENSDMEIYPELLRPHRSYLKEYRELNEKGVNIGGLCHITGGGFYENIPRVLPENLAVDLNLEIKSPFKEIGDRAGMSSRELLTVFNCGYGMLLFISPEFENKVDLELLGKVKLRENNSPVNINL